MKQKNIFICLLLLLSVSVSNAHAAFATSVDYSPEQLNQLWTKFKHSNETNALTYFPHGRCFKDAAKKHDIPEPLLVAMARGESNFDSGAVSKANAIGVMQIQWPGTAKHLGITNKQKLYEPCVNISAGAAYIKELIKRYQGSYYLALAAYNYGPGRIKVGSKPGSIPDGAHWYSEYVFDHLQYVLSTRLAKYSSANQSLLISFNRPYRAKSFIGYLNKKAPGLRFDWFKKPFDKFDVVFHYETASEKQRGIKLLTPLGFVVE